MRIVILLWLGLSFATAVAAPAENTLPAPPQVFSTRTVFALYANLQSASQSPIWKAIGEKAGPLAKQLHSVPGAPVGLPKTAELVPGLKSSNVLEIAVALEGDKVLSGLESDQWDPDSGFVAVARLTPGSDVQSLIQQVLDAIEKEKPGLRSPIEKSRRRTGAAELFDLPAELLGEKKLPFAVSFAVGPGKDGPVVGLGRTENLRDFVSGRTEGKLRDQKHELLTRRGQIWLYVAIPKGMTNNLAGGGAAALNSNPLLAGLTQSFDKVREVDASLNFGASRVDFELALGCADATAAGQLAGVIQGFVGMMQVGASANPGSVPPFVGKIKGAAEGAVFRLSTALTMRDFDLMLQNVSPGVAAARPAKKSPEPASASAPPVVRTPELPPVEVEFVQFAVQETDSLRTGKVRIQNRSSKSVRDLNLTFTYLDESGRRLGQWTRRHSSLTSGNLVDAATTRVVDCLAFHVPASTRKVTVTLHEVTFSDGEKWGQAP